MDVTAVFSHKTDEWYTPRDFFQALDREFHFTLDPCSTDENCVCEKHYTIKDDGLSKSWGGERVFCNPPYSQAYLWVKKAYEEAQNGAVVVMLMPSRTDTRWFHDYIYGKAEIRFIRGRLKFGGSTVSAPFPSMVAIFRKKTTFSGRAENDKRTE